MLCLYVNWSKANLRGEDTPSTFWIEISRWFLDDPDLGRSLILLANDQTMVSDLK